MFKGPAKQKIKKVNNGNVKGTNKFKNPLSKGGSTDYAAWDKFDVNAELEKLDGDIDEDSELTDECNENMYDEAILEKEKV